MFEKIENKLFVGINHIADLWFFRIIRKSFLDVLPLLFMGSLVSVVYYLPPNALFTYINQVTSGAFDGMIGTLFKGLSVMSEPIIAVSVGYAIMKDNYFIKDMHIPFTLIAGLILVSHFAMHHTTLNFQGGLVEIYAARGSETGNVGVFKTVMTAFLVTNLFLWLKSRRRYSNKLEMHFDSLEVIYSFRLLIPMAITLIATVFMREILAYFDMRHLFLVQFIEKLQVLPDLLVLISIEGIGMLLTFLSADGIDLMEEISRLLLRKGDYLGIATYMSEGFVSVFTNPGGPGATLSLVLAMFFVGRKRSDKLVKKAFIPSLLNVNEVILFGVPVIFNPYMFIPFILTPVVLTISTYLALHTGFIEFVTDPIKLHWSTPVFWGGYMVTGSIKGVFLQIFHICMGFFIYYPFVKGYDRYVLKGFRETYEKLEKKVFNGIDENIPLEEWKTDIGHMAKILIIDLKETLKKRSKSMYLVYQPQMSLDRDIHGVEALLRWKHPKIGFIAPPIIIFLAKEGGLDIILGQWIFEEACRQYSEWLNKGYPAFQLSINIMISQMKEADIIDRMMESVTRHNIFPGHIELELSENDMFDAYEASKEKIFTLREKQFLISLDDYGTGYSSIRYIKSMFLDIIKIDGILVQDVVENEATQEIIKSLAKLCFNFNILLIAEHVETSEQAFILNNLGCYIYQGWHFSQAMTPKEFEAFFMQLQKEGVGGRKNLTFKNNML